MLQVSRRLVRDFRAVCKRLLGGQSHKINPTVHFESGSTGLFVRTFSLAEALQYHVAGDYPETSFAVPLSALAECGDKSSARVRFEAQSAQNVTLSWEDGRIPRQHTVSQAQWDRCKFPATPTAFTDNPLLGLMDGEIRLPAVTIRPRPQSVVKRTNLILEFRQKPGTGESPAFSSQRCMTRAKEIF